MTYKISNECSGCGTCLPRCPTDAISVDRGQFKIDPNLCNHCEGYYPEPQCIVHCPISLPVPTVAKKGRVKLIDSRPPTSPDLFTSGKKNNPFASAIVLWEACNLLAQAQSLPWQTDRDGKLTLLRNFARDRGKISLWLTEPASDDSPIALSKINAKAVIDNLDIRSACMHSIYAAYATTLEKPWEQEFVISDRQIEDYLGLDKRKDLSKTTKLTLIKTIAQQPCSLMTSIDWPSQGRFKAFTIEKSRLWHLLGIQHHFQEDESGCKHLVGLTFRIKAGIWAKYFLNKERCQDGIGFYQYSSLPKSLLTAAMSLWQQHEGAVRMMLWLLFKTRMGQKQRITIPTLMRIAYGEEKILKAGSDREERKRRLRTFESDLAVLNEYGLKPIFDPVTYPPEIQPLWVKLAEIPDDADEALEFWINDGSNGNSLTDASPRGKWNHLMNARLLGFDLPSDWQQTKTTTKKEKHRSTKRQKSSSQPTLSGDQIAIARKDRGWSQRDLALRMGKSQSWIRDIENGRFRLKREDQASLREILELEPKALSKNIFSYSAGK
jgi:DNA-binding transcriptional regulator YiaG